MRSNAHSYRNWGQRSRHRRLDVQTSTSNAPSPFRWRTVSPFDPMDFCTPLQARTASRSALPALNEGVFEAAMAMASPVRGFQESYNGIGVRHGPQLRPEMAVREIVVEQRHEEHQGDDRIGRKEPLLPEPRDQPGADRPAREQHVARCEEQQQHDDDGGVLHRTISRYRSGIVGAASAPALERLCNRTPRPDNAQPSCTTRGESSNLAASDLSPPRPGTGTLLCRPGHVPLATGGFRHNLLPRSRTRCSVHQSPGYHSSAGVRRLPSESNCLPILCHGIKDFRLRLDSIPL